MRDELHLLELADRYLDGDMPPDERAAFELRMAASPELQSVVHDQRDLREGLARVPVRAAAAKAYSTYRFMQWMPAISLSTVVIIGAGAALWWMTNRAEVPHTTIEETVVAVPADSVAHAEHPKVALLPNSLDSIRSVIHTDTIYDTLYVATLNGKRVSWDEVPKNARVVEVRQEAAPWASSVDSVDPKYRQNEGRTLTKAEIAALLDSTTLLGQGTPAKEATYTEPMFKGGWDAMHSYLQKNLRPVKNSDASGVVEVDFLVDEQGRISDVQVKKSLSDAHDKEAVRVIQGMPKWLPCRTNDKPARCRMVVPLRFGGVVKERGK
ncbi:MAG: TonB family protein [Flavobacteriales bacterium]|nr:MAG: TonB family protein [Flavobacteriales bacterium]